MNAHRPRHARPPCPHHATVLERLAAKGNHPHLDVAELREDLSRCGECSGRKAGEGLGRER